MYNQTTFNSVRGKPNDGKIAGEIGCLYVVFIFSVVRFKKILKNEIIKITIGYKLNSQEVFQQTFMSSFTVTANTTISSL